MMEEKYFVHRIRRVNGVFDKGIEIKDTYDDARQAYSAQMSAWGYGHEDNCDYCSCMITSFDGKVIDKYNETWFRPAQA